MNASPNGMAPFRSPAAGRRGSENTLSFVEALVMLKGSDIFLAQAISLTGDSSAGPAVLENRAQDVADTLAGTDQPGTLDISGLARDLDLSLRAAAADQGRLPLPKPAKAGYDPALAAGLGRFDGASLTRMLLG